jgi:hypothetical protein
MANQMSLGAYTFALNPTGFTMPVKKRAVSAVETVAGVEVFSWGTFIEGTPLVLEWGKMSPAQFNQFNSLLEADAQVVFNPQTGTSYNIELVSLAGEYHLDQTANAPWRKNVRLELLIVSQV